MSKVYMGAADRKRAQEQKHSDLIRSIVSGRMKTGKVTTRDLGECLSLIQQGASYRTREGNITLMDLWKMQDLIEFTDEELLLLIRNDNSTKKAATPHHREQAAFNRNR